MDLSALTDAELRAQADAAQATLDALRAEHNRRQGIAQTDIEARLRLAARGKGDFSASELRFAATARCCCGAGYAYPSASADPRGWWECSAILMGQAAPHSTHDAPMPFAFYEVKSEDQPSACGATTRPVSAGAR